MANSFQKVMKVLKTSKSSIIIFLIIFNLMMATYTIPLLLRSDSDDVTGGQHVLLDKFQRRNFGQRGIDILNISNKGYLDVQPDEDYGGFPHGHMYNLQPKTGCDGDDPFLLIAVCSAAHHFDLRQTIRETWSSVIHRHRLSTKLVFMLGAPPSEYSHIQQHVIKESHVNNDIIQEDFIDSYINLTIKSIGVLKWAGTFCPGVRYVVKSDDDVFINVANLINLLMDMSTDRKYSGSKFLLGHIIENAKPITDRNSKWYAPTTLFTQDTYPTYLSGSAYVISGNSIEDLYSVATSQKPFWLEDIYITGMLPVGLGITLINNDKFTIRKPKVANPCFYKHVMAAHELSVTDLRRIWTDLHTVDYDCSRFHLDNV